MPRSWSIGGVDLHLDVDGGARAGSARAGPPGCAPGRASATGDTAPLLPVARGRPRARAEHRRRGVRPARGGGVARGPAGRRDARCAPSGGRTAGPERSAAASSAPVRPPAGRPRPHRVPARRLARGRAPCAARGAVRRARLRRPARTHRAADCARRVPRPRPWRRRLTGTDRRLHRPRSGTVPGQSRPGHDLGGRGVRPRRPPARGSTPRRCRVDEDGAVVSELGTAGAALLTPAHQFPLGATLSPTRRREVVAWARSTGGS